ncbi:MAG: hypothetical protein M1836_004440 [Candelina mexicana]|nr:MAG: hypothetical protein M1836_004440 [Candelina mexicana]
MDHTCDAIVAVVDKLPVIEARVHGQQNNFNGVLDKGREGLAILVGDSDRVAPNLWGPQSTNRTVDIRSLQQKNTICFQLYPGKSKMKRSRFSAPEIEPTYSFRSFQVPLANTVFHNGQTSTMYASRWTRESASHGIVRTKRTNIWNQLVKLPQHIDNGPTGRMAFWIPLAQLTPPRQVAAAVGNIIRLVYLTDHTSKTVPASEELEHRITQLSQSVRLDQQRVAVWALVTPRGRWSSEPTILGKILHHKLEQGSRLHRVLSGGGGWGQKQGLLSLDPESSCCTDGKSTAQYFGTGESFDQEEKEALGEVVKPGDLVQFFTTTTTKKNPRPSSKANVQSADQEARTLGYEALYAENVPVAIEFGTIPSTIDEMPEVRSSESDSTVSDNVEVAVNHFGALSEQGISMSITSFTNDTSEWLGAQRVGQVVQTKVDVPHSKFNYTAFDLDLESLTSAKQQSFTSFNGSDLGNNDVKDDSVGPEYKYDRSQTTFRRLSFPGQRGPRGSEQQIWRELERNGFGKDQEQSTGPAAKDMDEKEIEWLKKEKLRRLTEHFQQE